MSIHPFHPDSPEYAGMVESGRVGQRRTVIQNGCPRDSFDYDRRCGEPVAGTMQRSDLPDAPRLFACRDHLTAAVHGRFPMTVRYRCSVCETPQDAGYRLDDSGRCVQCQP